MTSLIVTLDYIKYDKYNFKLNPILEISFNNQFANLSGIDIAVSVLNISCNVTCNAF